MPSSAEALASITVMKSPAAGRFAHGSKTTLLHLAAGVQTPQAGTVVTDGVDVTALDDGGRRDFRIRRIGMVFQEFELLDTILTVQSFVIAGMLIVGLAALATAVLVFVLSLRLRRRSTSERVRLSTRSRISESRVDR